MTDPDWPNLQVWLGRHPQDDTLAFTASPGRIEVTALITNEPRPLVWLGVVARTAVQLLTGQSDYMRGVSILEMEDTSLLCVDAASRPGWPVLPYRLTHRDKKVTIGGRRDDEHHLDDAYTMPFPSDPDLVWDLDVLVEEATCRLTGIRDYAEASRVLGKRDRDRDRFGKPRTRRRTHTVADPLAQGRGWTTETKAPIPPWRGRDPRIIYGGLPGQGKRR
ncbi:hypothetical protein [Actinomadura violacea]|uniref:Uncharacterized protein n=1 Tax=Actinomadura violacea TaxID=2819934 RepID=A0ABS3RGV9_9ACTN|nr:hypothetical protein [Actinomadura violacea]MBO2455966.1 hypothetical protein [Actinomadura violacea]